MTAGAQLLGHYRTVLAASEQMLESARDERWEAVAHTSMRIKAMTGQLAGQEPEEILTPRENLERLAILKQLIEIDSKVRHLREPWVASLDRLLGPDRGPRPTHPMAGIALRAD